MPYEYLREPLTAAEVDRLASACETPTEQLVIWTLLDTGLRLSELCDLTRKSVRRQQHQLQVRDRGDPRKTRWVPLSTRVQDLLEHHFALEMRFPVQKRRAQKIVKAVADRAQITREVNPQVLRNTFAAMALHKGISLLAVQKLLGHARIETTASFLKSIGTH